MKKLGPIPCRSGECPLPGGVGRPWLRGLLFISTSLFLSCHLLIGLERENLHGGGDEDVCKLIEECEGADCHEVNVLYEVIGLSAGSQYACAVTAARGAKCWGENEYGKLGDGTTINRLAPKDVSGLTSGVTAVETGDFHTCALTAGGGVKCWGLNSHGPLGNGTFTDSAVPVDVEGLSSGATAISVGCCFSCALMDTGGVKCWGQNDTGELGTGTAGDTPTPVNVQGLPSTVKAISSGLGHTCAILSTDEVMCWGYNIEGQLGDGTTSNRTLPVYVTGLSDPITAISSGCWFTCALTQYGEVMCWGDNYNGQLGNGTTEDSTVPVQVSGLPTLADAISAHDSHACALLVDQKVACWGYNRSGQLGDSTTFNSSVPVSVLAAGGDDHLTRVSAVSTGDTFTCAMMLTGGISCWGGNYSGQLGDGTGTDRNTPGYVHCE